MLKDPYSPGKKPLNSFNLYGFKLYNIKDEKRIDRICRMAICNPGQNNAQFHHNDDHVEVTLPDLNINCKMKQMDLWEIDNIEKLKQFISSIVSM